MPRHPGSNLLRRATRLIAPTTGVQYLRNTGRTINPAGQYQVAYDAPVAVAGSHVQAMSLSAVTRNGLDTANDYVTWFVSKKVIGIERDFSGDRIIWDGDTWQCQTGQDWTTQDGWLSIVCVRVTS